MQNVLEDFYIPVRGGDQTTKIDTTKGLEYAAIEDVTYLRDKLFSALKIPKAYLGYEGELSAWLKFENHNLDINSLKKVNNKISFIYFQLAKAYFKDNNKKLSILNLKKAFSKNKKIKYTLFYFFINFFNYNSIKSLLKK
jgi:hypothetical protein